MFPKVYYLEDKKEILNEIYNERLNKIRDLNDKIDCSNLTRKAKSGNDSDFSSLKYPIKPFGDIRNSVL